MAAKEEKEKAKFVRETVVKYFFDMSKSTFTVMVLGGMAALFGYSSDQSGRFLLGDILGCFLNCHFIYNRFVNF